MFSRSLTREARAKRFDGVGGRSYDARRMPFAILENWQHRIPAAATTNALIFAGVAMVLVASDLLAAPGHRLSPPVLPEDGLRSRPAPQAGAPPASAPS